MKEITYNVKRIINTIPIVGDHVAYKDDTYINNVLTETVEGITLRKEIKKVSLNQEIVKSKSFWLHKKEIRKLIREETMTDEAMKEMYGCLIQKPYTYIEQNGLDNAEILHMSWYDHYLYDLNNNRLPKAIYFSDIDGQVNNAYFNLQEVLSVLSQHSDVEVITKGIASIPYYNAEEDMDKYISFIWKPTDEDWEKVKHQRDSFYLRELILKDIFGLTKKERVY